MRTFLSRLLLVALLGVLVLAVVKFAGGFGDPGALVSFGTSINPNELNHEAFRVEATVRLAVHAVGSFESNGALAVYGWIVDRASGNVVWQMLPENALRERGSMATVDDTLAFEPGIYDAWFTSFGDPQLQASTERRGFLNRLGSVISPEGRTWYGDADRWRFRLSYANEGQAEVVHGVDGDEERPDDRLPTPPGLIWASGPARNHAEHAYLFEVVETVDIQVTGVGEVVDGILVDGGRITGLFDDAVVWDMAQSSLEWAGGAQKNQRVMETITMPPGFYTVSYTTDQSHAYDDWTGNPPMDPRGWGLRLTLVDPSALAAVLPFDAWSGRLPQIASFSCVGEDALLEDTFSLPDSTAVMISSIGEVIGSSAYDYAVLLRQPPNQAGSQVVWSMEDSPTVHAGGADKNRLAEEVLTLPPGTYVLSYRTDGSHDCEDFNSDPPDHPERWGATLFAVDPGFDLSTVRRDAPTEDQAYVGTDSLGVPTGKVLVRFNRVGNNEHRRQTFLLEEAGSVRIYGLGEITPSGAYDYAWIEDENGHEVWAMRRDNTSSAGGSAKNRLFDGTLSLAAGRYTAHYVTDGSHAFGDFSQPPNDPTAWGVLIYRQ